MTVDTLIIGSGVAAAALAECLLEHNPNASILLLEAGGKVKMKDYGLWTEYLVSGELPYTSSYDFTFPVRETPGENESIGATLIPLAGALDINVLAHRPGQ